MGRSGDFVAPSPPGPPPLPAPRPSVPPVPRPIFTLGGTLCPCPIRPASSPSPRPSPPTEPRLEADFAELVEAARMAHVKTGEHNLWKAAFALPEWFFVAASHGEDAEPVVGIVDGQPHILGFTDEEQAQALSQRRASRQNPAAAPAPVLHMTPAEAVDYCKKLIPEGIAGILFNSGPSAFQTTLARLVEMHRHPPKQH